MSEIQSTAEEPGELPDFEKYYLLFAGSSEEDVEFAKAFWNSVALHPPLESRLVSADIKQRLRVAQPHPSQPQRNFAHEPQAIEIKTVQLLLEAHRKQKIEEKSQYLEKSKRRDEIIALLKKQREERIKKESVSAPYKPKIYASDLKQTAKDYEDEAQETMKALQGFD
ncbi:cilia- and flagella-associated protein HOATZ isoform X2 [Protopterus annectens]|uniref:cilia- and flagella-associated protein HOATZ isoform X2 n=1 Tax=Protopterus annectens TaxID=7888 RepID=UPI001CF9E7C1|nr:cilia- and flagella-associated protein HOATZ isoform X2 [Protopterus annectens]